MLLIRGNSLFGKFRRVIRRASFCFDLSRYFAKLGIGIDEGIPFVAVEGRE